ncbi:nuclease-related domain-containing protein [Gimesia chilikensis]|nr:nuclease-related domain-containing protein [Gimesia chilikensis]
MFSNFSLILIPILLSILGMGIAVAIIYCWLRKQNRHYRESPLTQDLMRPPGHSLQLKVNELGDEVTLYLMFMLGAPILLYSFHLSESYFGGEPESALRTAISFAMGMGVVGFFGYRLSITLDEKKKYALGLQGEMFTGEELNQLMLDGCRVFHDLQFPYGNIDHVVVSPSGVYSINTKMRGKPKQGEGRAELIVDYQNNVLRFPDYEHPIPQNQLEAESNWLSKHLTSAIGNQVKVQPILALPGWFIKERIGRGSISVINPKKPNRFFVNNHITLSATEMQQIAHQLEQLCRNVKPSYRAKKK